MSDDAKRLDSFYQDILLLSGSVGMELVSTRQKLQPFVSEGVVYEDRKKRKNNEMIITEIDGK